MNNKAKKLSEQLKEANALTAANRPEIIALEQFTKVLNSKPKRENIKDRQGFKYLSISQIENELDRLFAGLWQTKAPHPPIIENGAVSLHIELSVFHPVAKIWLTRCGVGTALIRNSKNALEMDLPHAKADAIKNAAKSLGDIFGRNLTRKLTDITEYKPVLLDKLKALQNENEK